MATDNKATYIIDGKNLLSRKLAEIDKDAQRTEKTIAGIGQGGMGGGGGQMGGGFTMLKGAGANLLAGGITNAVGAMKDFGVESIKSFAKFEQFGVALTTMFHGNKAEAKGLSDELVQFAKTTPFELTEIQDATKQLIAYGSTSGGVGKELKMLGDISSGVGAPLGEIAYLYGTARTQGRLFARDIYQLSGRGIPIVEALAKQFKVTKDKVMDLVSAGKVGFPQMQQAMQGMTGEGGQFFNMMNEQSKTLAGRWSNLMDAIGQFQTKLAENKAGMMGSLVDWSQQFVNNLVQAQQIVNDLQKSKEVSHTDNQNWFQRNFQFGRQVTTNKENLQGYNNVTKDLALKALGEGDQGMFKKYAEEIKTQADKDAKFLGVGPYKGMMHGSRGGGLDKRGFNEEEVRAELGMLSIISDELKSKALLKLRDKKGNLTKAGMGGEDTNTGTGTTIEAGTPKNLTINVYGGVGTGTVINSVDGNIPNGKLRDGVGQAFLELLNDGYLAMR